MSETTDDAVGRLILAYLHGDLETPYPIQPDDEALAHLSGCPDARVKEAETQHALWWDTGVDATEFEAEIACPHSYSGTYKWGELGELPDLLRDLDDLQRGSDG